MCLSDFPARQKPSLRSGDLAGREYDGREIYFDDELIRKDGIFVHPKLKDVLSEEALKG